MVAPILQSLILNRDPELVLTWVNKVAKWPFQRIIPCHLENNIKAGPNEFKRAFDFLYEDEKQLSFPFNLFSSKKNSCAKALETDGKFLSEISNTLTKQGTLYPEAPKLSR